MSSNKDLGEPTLPPCRVCGRRASGLHFGVITCEACKAFYKRSRGRERPFVCRGKELGKCVIKNGKTPLCSFCRLQTCLKAGMCREGINKGRCPIEKKAELLLEAREHQQEMLRQKILNEKRGITEKTSNTVVNMKTENRVPIPSVTATEYRQPEPVQEFNLTPNNTDPNQHFLGHDPALFNPELTLEASGGQDFSNISLDPVGYAPQDSQYGEFMNLLMTEDPLRIEPGRVMNENNTASGFSPERLMEIIAWLDTVVQSDIETQLYDDEETEQAMIINATHRTAQQAKEELLGPLKPLSHEVYTEVYNATGIDVDDYRQKPNECLQDCEDDIYTFIEFLRRIPKFADHDLNDRLRLTKVGYGGWMLLSSYYVYDHESECISCSMKGDSVWTDDDFIRYFGPEFEGTLANSLHILQKCAISLEELAVLKMHNIYRDRPYASPKGSGKLIKEQQDLINDSLVYLFEANRGQEVGQLALAETMKAMDALEKVTRAATTNAIDWPTKFPEFEFPQLWLEMSGIVPEEALIVAVSTNLKISDYII